jgi:aminomethyltransferase
MIEVTPLHDWHQANGGRMVEFAGWELPVQYEAGIITEHLACRKGAALFDISHMGRFRLRGPDVQNFLEGALTNDPARLEPGRAHYTFLCDEEGHPRDDAYLFRLDHQEWLLVVNAGNRAADWGWLNRWRGLGTRMDDLTNCWSMLALQGPVSQRVLQAVLSGDLPASGQGRLNRCSFQGGEVMVSRTGYTGEPLSFELFVAVPQCVALWLALLETGRPLGLMPAGLGSRDTLRLEAGLPLYGHEIRADLPLMSLPLARHGLDLQGDRPFLGRETLAAQAAALEQGNTDLVPSHILPILALERGMMREGATVFLEGRQVGRLTSGTTVPAWRFAGDRPGDEHYTRAMGLALLQRGVQPGAEVEVHYRDRPLKARVMKSLVKRQGDFLRALEP